MKSDDANPPLFIQLVASIVFISFGVVAAFCCAIVDGVFAARHIVSNFKSSFLINLGKKHIKKIITVENTQHSTQI